MRAGGDGGREEPALRGGGLYDAAVLQPARGGQGHLLQRPHDGACHHLLPQLHGANKLSFFCQVCPLLLDTRAQAGMVDVMSKKHARNAAARHPSSTKRSRSDAIATSAGKLFPLLPRVGPILFVDPLCQDNGCILMRHCEQRFHASAKFASHHARMLLPHSGSPRPARKSRATGHKIASPPNGGEVISLIDEEDGDVIWLP